MWLKNELRVWYWRYLKLRVDVCFSNAFYPQLVHHGEKCERGHYPIEVKLNISESVSEKLGFPPNSREIRERLIKITSYFEKVLKKKWGPCMNTIRIW